MKTERSTEDIVQGFLRFHVSYEIELGNPITNELMLPVSFLHFGEFEPTNCQLFVKKWKKVEYKCKSPECPIDKDIVESLQDFRKFMCNLVEIPNRDGNKYLGGLFRFSCGIAQQH